MKRTIIIITMIFASASLMAQGEIVNKYFDQLSSDETFTKVSVSSKMFSLFTELEPGSDAEKEFVETVSKLKGLKIILSDSTTKSKSMYSKVISDVQKAGYEELMSVQDGGENMRFSIKEKGGVISELLMVVGGKEKFVFLSLYGEIDLKNISKIANAMRVEGLERLSKLDENKN